MSAFNLNEPIYSISFIIHSESASRNYASAASTVEADPGNSAPSDFVPQQQGMNEGTKNTSYDHLFAGTDLHVIAYQTKSISEGLKIALTQPITGKGDSSIARQIEEETFSTIKLEDLAKLMKDDGIHATENVETEDTSVPISSIPGLLNSKAYPTKSSFFSSQNATTGIEKIELKELLGKSLKTEFLNILYAHDFSTSLPTELKDLPSNLNELTGEVKGLKKQVHELEIKLPGDLKEIPTKLDDFTKNVTSLTSQVAELKTLQWELPAKFLSLPTQVASVQAKLKTLDALPSLLLNVTQALNKFAQVLNSASSKVGDQSVPSAGQADTMHDAGEDTNNQTISSFFKKDKGKKAMSSKDAEEVSTESESDDETTHVPGSMVEYSKKKELKKRAKLRITNYDILTRKGPITLKVYREDDTSEIIPEFKASDLHLGEWREIVTACPNKKGKGWTSIYKQTQERIDYLRTTEGEQGINLDRPLSEQDPLDRLNDMENKKRKHTNDIHDFFRANKRLKSSVQYEDHPAGIALNEPVLETKERLLGKSSVQLLSIPRWKTTFKIALMMKRIQEAVIEVSSDENEVTKIKALMALTDEERVSVGKESARNDDWTKISIKKGEHHSSAWK
ncbi:hypothetical protein Tco_1343143 [Tanacetum coccineum]